MKMNILRVKMNLYKKVGESRSNWIEIQWKEVGAISRAFICIIWTSRMFQRLGAASAKALSPLFFSINLGTSRNICFVDLCVPTGVWWCLERKGGANPFRVLKTWSTILKWTGSRWREASKGVTLSLQLSRRAAAFCKLQATTDQHQNIMSSINIKS